ncbi:unnamed protein product, partial [Hapterophycus canaliculatus]
MASVQQADENGLGRQAAREENMTPAMPTKRPENKEEAEDGGMEEQEQEKAEPPPNRMAEAIERGGILGWGSYLTFAWAGPFLKLGSSVTLKEEHLEGIYD